MAKQQEQATGETVKNPQSKREEKRPSTDEEVKSGSDSSGSDSDEEEATDQKPRPMVHNAMKVPKAASKREDKAYRKQRKAIRKMIRRTMMDHSREVIQGLVEEDLAKKN